MTRLAAALMIALTAFAMQGGLVKPVLAEQSAGRPAVSQASPTPMAGHRSERLLSLLLALEALRAAPGLLDSQKV
jgi:hypothetical protein